MFRHHQPDQFAVTLKFHRLPGDGLIDQLEKVSAKLGNRQLHTEVYIDMYIRVNMNCTFGGRGFRVKWNRKGSWSAGTECTVHIDSYVHIDVHFGVKLTITEFRRDLFKLVDKAIAGETVEFERHGKLIRLVVPEHGSSRLDRLTPRQVTNNAMSEKEHRAADRKLQAEILAEMQKDWAEI